MPVNDFDPGARDERFPLLRCPALDVGSCFRKFRSEGFARRDQSSLVRILCRLFQLLDLFLRFDGVCAKDESHD